MNIKRSVFNTACAGFLLLALAGCGGSDGGDQVSGPGTGSGSSPDAFINRVIAVIDNTSETAEPEDIGSVNPTKPENAEPVSVN